MAAAPAVVRWLVIAVLAAVTAYHVRRLTRHLRSGVRADADVAVSHTLMGIVMVLMLAGALPGAAARPALALFVLVGCWFAGRALLRWRPRGGQPAAHATAALAMAYMLGGADGAMTMPVHGLITSAGVGALVLALVGTTAWSSAPALRPARAVQDGRRSALLGVACQLAMTAATVSMLV